ncbi:transposase [Actinoplanes sp. N902-109]|uniref:transposase n=1 Tax=Actinoplanes sp. (strain N902-109) TaxID=649831 RepID=UPI0009FF6391
MPERYGPWRTPRRRVRRWAADGTWARLKPRSPPSPSTTTATGTRRSTRRSGELISMLPEPRKETRPRRGAGTRRLPWRADHHDPHAG